MEVKLVKSPDPEIIVHSWDGSSPSLNPPTFIPKWYVKEKSKGLRLAAGKRSAKTYGDMDPKIKSIMFRSHEHPGGIDVVGDLLSEDMKAVAVYALEFEDMISRVIGAAPKNIPYRIRIYRGQEKFRRVAIHAGAPTAMSYYDPRTRDIVMWFDETLTLTFTHNQLQALLAHEFCHAYMDIVYGVTSPLWFAEGMAGYFEHFTWMGDRVDPGAINELSVIKLENNLPLPIEKFVNVSRDQMYGPMWQGLYAEAWAVVHFLFNYDPQVIRELLKRGRPDVAGLNGEFKEHLQAMMRMS